MRQLKDEYIKKINVISSFIKVGTRGGINEYVITYFDGTEELVLEHEIDKYFKEG